MLSVPKFCTTSGLKYVSGGSVEPSVPRKWSILERVLGGAETKSLIIPQARGQCRVKKRWDKLPHCGELSQQALEPSLSLGRDHGSTRLLSEVILQFPVSSHVLFSGTQRR